MKRYIAIIAAAAATVITTMAASWPHDSTTFTFVEHETNFAYVIHGQPTTTPPPTGLDVGDRNLFSSQLLRNGQVVGFANGDCTTEFSHNSMCTATFDFYGQGDIYISALIIDGATPQSPSDFDASVLGGTGRFRYIRGAAHTHGLQGPDTLWTLTVQGL